MFKVKCVRHDGDSWKHSHTSYETNDPADALRMEQKLRRQDYQQRSGDIHSVFPHPELCPTCLHPAGRNPTCVNCNQI